MLAAVAEGDVDIAIGVGVGSQGVVLRAVACCPGVQNDGAV